ncbi:MAG: NADH:ubiquinone oxidoreductase subunit 6 [Acidimicrobiaceae bacterium]|jgi:NADH-quinone oxidoreductase subunit J|nr:NADH:ubiquinone oxidoreductase subunit 6 [Acidimicrobiaceae bacterium]
MGGATVVAAATVPDALTFAIAAVICVGGAFGVVLMRSPVHAALSLVATLFGIAVLFVEEDAQFLAAVQVIVYTGAIVVLFLFVIMLLGVDRKERVLADVFKGQRVVALVLGLMVLAEVVLLGRSRWTTGAHSATGSLEGSGSNVAKLGRALFTAYLVPFEVTSALLIVAVVGAVVLARRPDHRPVEPIEEVEVPLVPGPDDDPFGAVGTDEDAGGSTAPDETASTVPEHASSEPEHEPAEVPST